MRALLISKDGLKKEIEIEKMQNRLVYAWCPVPKYIGDYEQAKRIDEHLSISHRHYVYHHSELVYVFREE